MDKTTWGELEPDGKVYSHLGGLFTDQPRFTEEEEEESEEEEEDDEEEAVETQADGLQTPSGLETPSGMASVVSTVAGGLETPDFLELRKNATRVSDAGDSSSRSLYQVVPERQTSVRGLMGSDRAYDISGVSGTAQNLPVLGEERGTKVSVRGKCEFANRADSMSPVLSERPTESICQSTRVSSRTCRKKSFDGDMMLRAVVLLGSLEAEKTFRTWLRPRWRRRSRRWSDDARQRRRNSNSDYFF